MKALVYKGPRRLAVEAVPEPRRAEGELLIEPLAVGICGSDVHGYAGETGRRRPGQIMGHEASGRVVAADAASGWRAGDRLTFNPVLGCGSCERCATDRPHLCPERSVIGVDSPYTGAFAERMVIPACSAVPLPDGVATEAGALVEPLAVGIHAARQAAVEPGDHVAVLGAGMIGLTCAWACRRAGAATVFATDFDARKLETARALGAVPVEAGGSLADHVRAVTGRSTVDRVIDAVGITATIATALEVTDRGGTICLVGLGAPRVDLPAFALTTDERSMRGSFCYAPSDFAAAADAIASGAFDASRFIDRHVELSDAPDAFAGLADNRRPSVKTIVRIAADE